MSSIGWDLSGVASRTEAEVVDGVDDISASCRDAGKFLLAGVNGLHQAGELD